MEIRCKGCNKLFRISDEKITGKGIKFACTRCHEYVRVTKEEYEQYTLSKSAVSVLDLFEDKDKPKTDKASATTAEGQAAIEEPPGSSQEIEHPVPSVPDIKQEKPAPAFEEPPVFAEPSVAAETQEIEHPVPSVPDIKQEEQAPALEELPVFAEPSVAAETKDIGNPASSVPDLKQEEQAPAFEEPATFAEPTTSSFSDNKQEEHAPPAEESGSLSEPTAVVEPKSEPEPVTEQKAEAKLEYEQEPKAESKPELLTEPQPEPQQPALRPEPALIAEPAPAIKPEPAIPDIYAQRAKEPKTETVRTSSTAATGRQSSITPPISQQKPSYYSPPVRERSTRTTADVPVPPRSANKFLVYLVLFIIVGLVAYGTFMYIGSGSQKGDELSKQISSTEGLRIVTASGSSEPNGDLLITCVVENSLNKERPVWYVVVDLYNTQGAMLNKIRSLNGKQLYTQRDYEILSQRGLNIQELKTKNLQDQGITIPPKGSVTFEMRYLQPTDSVANFNAIIQPFDPVRLFKELAEEIR